MEQKAISCSGSSQSGLVRPVADSPTGARPRGLREARGPIRTASGDAQSAPSDDAPEDPQRFERRPTPGATGQAQGATNLTGR
jgi:hypothetical protein